MKRTKKMKTIYSAVEITKTLVYICKMSVKCFYLRFLLVFGRRNYSKQTNKQTKKKKKNGRNLNDLVFYQAYAQNICISF